MSDLDRMGLIVTLLFIAAALLIIPLNEMLDARQKRRDARRRNQAHPWRRDQR